MSLGGRVPANADEHRRELAEIRDRLNRLEAWRVGLRSMLAVAAATYSGDLSRFADQLHDAMDDEGLPDLTMRTAIDQRPTDRVSRTALGGFRDTEVEDGPCGC